MPSTYWCNLTLQFALMFFLALFDPWWLMEVSYHRTQGLLCCQPDLGSFAIKGSNAEPADSFSHLESAATLMMLETSFVRGLVPQATTADSHCQTEPPFDCIVRCASCDAQKQDELFVERLSVVYMWCCVVRCRSVLDMWVSVKQVCWLLPVAADTLWRNMMVELIFLPCWWLIWSMHACLIWAKICCRVRANGASLVF